MSRILTFTAIGVTAAVSLGLYQLSYEVQRLEDELADLNRALVQEQQTQEVLHAEWSYVTRPEVLQERTVRNLEMQPVIVKQIVGLAEIPRIQDRVNVPEPPKRRIKPPAVAKREPPPPVLAMPAKAMPASDPSVLQANMRKALQ